MSTTNKRKPSRISTAEGVYSNTSARCRGCLSADRILSPLGDYMELFYTLLRVKTDSFEDLNYYNISVCWECKAHLRNVQKFKNIIQNSQYLLQQSVYNLCNIKEIHLSTLTSTYKNYYDVTIQHDDVSDCNNETQNKEESSDVDTSTDVAQLNVIKEEESDDDSRFRYEYETFDHEKTIFEQDDYKETNDIKCSTVKNTIEDNKTYMKRSYTKMALKIQCRIDINRLDEYFTEVDTSQSVIDDSMKEKRNDLKKPFKCEVCAISFKRLKDYNSHMKAHEGSGTESQQQRQFYKCKLCHSHLALHKRKKHLQVPHYEFICKNCPYKCGSLSDFIVHYKDLHARMICDYCGKTFNKRKSIEIHIRRHHYRHKCRTCDRTFKNYYSLDKHIREYHPENCNKELAYCVECDKQYTSVYKYKRHLATGVKHKAPKKLRIPCPDCGKVFVRTTYMNNHYKLMHMKISKHHCDLCDKYFINSYSVRKHKQTVHEKILLPKNKICEICGRGFRVNRTLKHHIRTHTGEKPHKCTSCMAAFAQKVALIYHMKTIHKNIK